MPRTRGYIDRRAMMKIGRVTWIWRFFSTGLQFLVAQNMSEPYDIPYLRTHISAIHKPISTILKNRFKVMSAESRPNIIALAVAANVWPRCKFGHEKFFLDVLARYHAWDIINPTTVGLSARYLVVLSSFIYSIMLQISGPNGLLVWPPGGTMSSAVMGSLETLSHLETVSRQYFCCLGLGLEG